MKLESIRSRLLVSYLAVCAIGIVVLFVAVRVSAPSFFQHHIGNMAGMHGPGGMMTPESDQLDSALTRSLNEGFLIATAIALPLGAIASLLVSEQIATPVKRLATASGRVARGEYGQSVPVGGPSEINELATNFNAMASALQQVEQRRIELIGDIAHELRTPVTVLSGYVEGLADGVFPANPETWAMLGEETTRLSRLVQDFQDLSRAEAGQLEFRLAETDPSSAARTAAARLMPDFAAKGVALDVRAPQTLPSVSADFDRLVQVLNNLLTNALKYTPAPGHVDLEVRPGNAGIEFVLRDSGIGIAPEQLPHVFERFYRADRSRARSSGGSGVGLTIARAIAEAMGGKLAAESPGVGQGATFTVWLPLA